MEVTDRQTWQSNPSNLSIWHLFLLSFTPHTNFGYAACVYTKPSLSLSLFISLSCKKTIHILPNVAQTDSWQRLWRSFFNEEWASARHENWGKYISSPTMASDWPSNSSELKARWRTGDMHCLNHLTWLVMPAIRPAPWDFLKRKCVPSMAENALICCLLSVG